MQVCEAIGLISRVVESVPGFELPKDQAELLIASALGISTMQLRQMRDYTLSNAELATVHRYLEAPTRIPIPLFLGYCELNGLRFSVSEVTLLPGTETLALINKASEIVDGNGRALVVEVGTGSGVIAVSLACAHPDCRIFATEISPEAASVARHNILQHGVSDRVSVGVGNWYEPLAKEGLDGKVDLVVSNPPYCSTETIKSLPKGFVEFAPRLAIDGGHDGLHAHRAVIEGSRRFLRTGGHLLLQTDDGQAESVAQCIRQSAIFADVHISTGSEGGTRFACARKGRYSS